MHNKKEELEYKLETGEKKHGKEKITICTSAAKETLGTLNTSPPLTYTYRREGLSERKRKAKNSIFVLQQISHGEVHSKKQKKKGHGRKSQALTGSSSLSVPRKSNRLAKKLQKQAETVSSKSSLRPKQKKKGKGKKLQATGSSSRSVPKKKNKKSKTFVQRGIEEQELNKRQTYNLPGRNERSPSIFDLDPKVFDWVDTRIGYKESLLNFAKNLGPGTQSTVSKKLELLASAQATEHALRDPIPHASSSRKFFNDPKGKSVVMNKGSGRNSVSARDERPMGYFDKVGTLSAGSAYISPFTRASGIQIPADVVHGIIRENVHCPIHGHNQLVLQQQQRRPPSNAAVTNSYTVLPGYQVPIAYEARTGTRGVASRSQNLPPRQIAYPLTTVRPSPLSPIYTASGSGYGVWDGHQCTPLNVSQYHANPAALEQGFQQTLHNSHMQLQNQLGWETHQQPQMALQQPLPLLRNMFDAGTSHTETFTSAQYHQTTSSAARNGEQLPLAGRTYPNLELQLRTKPLSPGEAN